MEHDSVDVLYPHAAINRCHLIADRSVTYLPLAVPAVTASCRPVRVVIPALK